MSHAKINIQVLINGVGANAHEANNFTYDNKNHKKIRNAKILRWRSELSQY